MTPVSIPARPHLGIHHLHGNEAKLKQKSTFNTLYDDMCYGPLQSKEGEGGEKGERGGRGFSHAKKKKKKIPRLNLSHFLSFVPQKTPYI